MPQSPGARGLAAGSPRDTCELALSSAAGAETCHQLPVGLEDEDATSLVVHHDDVPIAVHGDTLGAHQPPRAQLCLRGTEGQGGRCHGPPTPQLPPTLPLSPALSLTYALTCSFLSVLPLSCSSLSLLLPSAVILPLSVLFHSPLLPPFPFSFWGLM